MPGCAFTLTVGNLPGAPYGTLGAYRAEEILPCAARQRSKVGYSS